MAYADRIKNFFWRKRHGFGAARLARAGKWSIIFVLIGVIAGLGSVVFQYLCEVGSHFFMGRFAGYYPPLAGGETPFLPPQATSLQRWALLILPAIGGIFSGWLIYTFAPEAEGHGTDAAIDAYHNKGGYIRGRVPFIKTIASVITLTTGGSGGREGPIAQIGAGFGSFLATRLKLSNRERRIMLAAGIGAGVGSIFRAPLAGALFASEVLYSDPDFESEVIIPAGISSVVAYCLLSLFFGWGSLFHSPEFMFKSPLELGPYIVLAVVLVGLSFVYVKSFYGVTKIFKVLKIPNHVKPAIGGLLTGMVGFYFPYTLAFGYGYAQQAIYSQLTIPFLLTLAFGKILTTSFTIGSGGSGGVFGPSIVIGGAMGGVVGLIFHGLAPGLVSDPGAFVVVGMAGFFAAASSAPISTIIFVSEMTNSYELLLPSLFVCSLSYMASKRWGIYIKQVKSRVLSPAHAGEFLVDVLQTMKVSDLMHLVRKVETIPEGMPFSEFKRFFSRTKQHHFPVMGENNRLIGIFSGTDVRGVLFSPEIEHLVVMRDIATTEVICTTASEDLNSVLRKLTTKNIDALPVVAEDDPGILLGMLNRRDLIAFYNRQIHRLREGDEAAETAAA
ncbi:MAG: chloride channel protein [Deltaproteobacteria bacterium]|nr:chloride channel protein [Deltaproteobacteria bacterium]